MKKTILGLMVLVAFASCTQTEKTGFVNNSELINDYQGKLDIEEKYKLIDEVSKKKSDSLGRAYQQEVAVLQQKMSSMSEQQQQVAAQPFQQKWQVIDQQIKAEQQKFQADFQTEIDSSITEVVDFVKGYAESNGYTYIFGTSDVSRSVMYGKEANDLTDEVLEALNTSYKEKK
ncbi:OmpH family outer membrane protein [Winogradskyella psychrotolerans]|uniref:OmpH family outer membrane protein n=1 Tax=Winogradskyella psychrotolerans TaxID=1344585 RepID=UPI001C07DD18|nr:OmpH family outer membrane protein [Winogradskyella psychrotolerans]MBU2926765.1 OmpH family outer membrane protein [Winogradskyella psychrotolerans]